MNTLETIKAIQTELLTATKATQIQELHSALHANIAKLKANP